MKKNIKIKNELIDRYLVVYSSGLTQWMRFIQQIICFYTPFLILSQLSARVVDEKKTPKKGKSNNFSLKLMG